MIDLAILSGGVRIPLATNDATDTTIADGAHGDEQAHVTLPRTLVEGLAVYEAPLPQLIASEHGAPIATYRVEQPALSDAQLELTALGAGRALSDVRQTTLWSQDGVDGWRPATRDDNSTRFSEQARIEIGDGRIEIAPQKGETFSSNFVIGATFETPMTQNGQGGRPLAYIQYDWSFIAPANWQFLITSFDRAYTTQTVLLTTNATGALITGSVFGTFSGVDRIEFLLYYNAAAAVYAGETGAAKVRITNLRVTTIGTNNIGTTFTSAVAAGSNVTAAVGSTARMYVGQRLVINSSVAGNVSESVVVKQIVSATQFVADFVFSHAIGQAVAGCVVYTDEIVRDVLSQAVALNPAQLSSSAGLIQTCAQDQTTLAYADADGMAILNDLEVRTGWRWAVRNKLLSFAPIGTNAQTWYVDATSYTVQRTLADLANRGYGVYQPPGPPSTVDQRTVSSNDIISQQRFGLVRMAAVSTNTTNATLVAAQRDQALAASANPVPQAQITFDAIYTAQGARVPPWMVRADDTLIIRNLPPQAAQSRDRIRALLITRREVNLTDGSITVEAQPLFTIERLIGRDT